MIEILSATTKYAQNSEINSQKQMKFFYLKELRNFILQTHYELKNFNSDQLINFISSLLNYII